MAISELQTELSEVNAHFLQNADLQDRPDGIPEPGSDYPEGEAIIDESDEVPGAQY